MFPDPDHASAYERLRLTARSPVGFDASVRGVQSGMGAGQAFDWPVIGQALVEMDATGAKPTPEVLRAFCRKLTPKTAKPSGSTRQDQNLAAIAEGLRLYREVSGNGE